MGVISSYNDSIAAVLPIPRVCNEKIAEER